MKNKSKPGEITLMLGVTLIFAAILAFFIMRDTDKKYLVLTNEGVVSEAIIKNKNIETETQTTRKGRTRTSKNYILNVQYDYNAKTKYVDWKQNSIILKSDYPALTTGDIGVSENYYNDAKIGDQIYVVSNPTDYQSLMLAQKLTTETSAEFHIKWYLGLGLGLIIGSSLTFLGFQQRFLKKHDLNTQSV